MEPVSPLPGRGELFQQILDLGREVGEAAGPGAVGKRVVDPQVAQHLHQVGLAAPEEAANPGRRLLRIAEVIEVALEQAHESFLVLALADEGL